MHDQIKTITAPTGWAVFSHIHRPHGAWVTNDPLDKLLKGIRYHIRTEALNSAWGGYQYSFSFETWYYRARGPILHQSLLSFDLLERAYPDPRVTHYVSNIKNRNRLLEADYATSMSVIRFTADAIRSIDMNEPFDWVKKLKSYGLPVTEMPELLTPVESESVFETRVLREEGAF